MSHILNKFKLAPIPEIVNQYNISEENPFIKENDYYSSICLENENNEYALNKKKIKNESHSISFKTEDTLNMKEFFPLGSTIKKQEQPSNTKKTEKNKILIKSEIDEEINIQNLKENKLWIKALDLLVIDYDRFVRNIENVDSFCNLDSPFDQYNILMIQKQIFFNSKILKLVVYLKDFEIYNDIVKAKLIDFSGEITGSFPIEIFHEENEVFEQKTEEIKTSINQIKIKKFEKNEKIYLKRNAVFILKNATVYCPNENTYYLNISENNIEYYIY